MDDDAADDNDGGYGHGVGDGDGLGLGPGDDNDDESSPLSLYYLVSVLSEREQILLQVENISLSPLLLVFAFPTLLHIQHPFSRHSLYKKKVFFIITINTPVLLSLTVFYEIFSSLLLFL